MSKTMLIDFLRTGKLGELALGINLDSIIEYLGIPADYESKVAIYDRLAKLQSTSLLMIGFNYGALDLGIHPIEHTLLYIKIRFDDRTEKVVPEPVNLGWMDFLDDMNLDEFKAILKDQNLSYSTEFLAHEGLLLRIQDSCVGISFDLENTKLIIQGISKQVWTSNCSQLETR